MITIPLGAKAAGRATSRTSSGYPKYNDELYRVGYNYAKSGLPMDTWMHYGGTSYTTPISKGYSAGRAAASADQNALANLLKSLSQASRASVGGYAPSTFKLGEPPKPEVPMLTLDEMMDIINRRVGLLVDPQIEALRRNLEEEKAAHKSRVGETRASYEEAREQLQKMGQEHQRQAASTMRKRGIYDTGLAMDLSNRLQRQTSEHGAKLETELARVLDDLAEYIATRERHIGEQIEGLEGRRGEWAQSLLEEMESRERDRRDRLEQQAFENWLAQQSMAHQVWQANQQARAAAARASASTSRGPSFQDILDQMKLQYMLTNMSPEERFIYATSPSLWERQTMPGWEDYLGQQRMNRFGSLGPDERLRVLFNELYGF